VRVVVDASVAVKWIFPEPERESEVAQALSLLAAIGSGQVEPLQPPHWLAEVAAVVTRIRPEIAEPALDLLDALELPVLADIAVFRRASRLGAELSHHLFDTLYHAVALESGTTLVTADDPYFRKACHIGHIVQLRSWTKEWPERSGPRSVE
jgi:predicted nucleic acid-binding protein